jgi:ATPase subunit of ABC transporter with duplicated ATPase domains
MSDKLSELKNAAIEAEGTVENLKAELSAIESAETVDKDAVKAKKADLRKAESALKKANTAVTKEEATIERNAEREAKKAEKEAEKAAKQAERDAKAKAREEAKAAKAAEREANRMPEQNGIRRPKPDTLCGRAWQIADDLSAKFGQPTPIKDLLEAAEAEGLNAGNVKAEYARWRKFYGITGRVALPKEEAATE